MCCAHSVARNRALFTKKLPHERRPASSTGDGLVELVGPPKAALLFALLLWRLLLVLLLGGRVFTGAADGLLQLLPAPARASSSSSTCPAAAADLPGRGPRVRL